MYNILKCSGSGVYQIKSIINCKKYIGSAANIRIRFNAHLNALRRNQHNNIYLQNHYNKYGKSDLEFSILELCLQPSVIEREQFFIDNIKPEFNICLKASSCIGVKQRPETIKKRVLAKSGYRHSEETKQKMRESHIQCVRGKQHPLYGKKRDVNIIDKMRLANIGKILSEETRKKISDSNKGRVCSPETRDKIRKAHKGKVMSSESRKKMSDWRMGRFIGENHPRFGKHHTSATRKKISNAIKGRKLSADHIEKIKELNKGERNPMYGKKFSTEHKQKLRNAWVIRKERQTNS